MYSVVRTKLHVICVRLRRKTIAARMPIVAVVFGSIPSGLQKLLNAVTDLDGLLAHR